MSRTRPALTAVLLTCAAVSGCTAGTPDRDAPPASATASPAEGEGEPQPLEDDSAVPVTRQLSQGDLTRAIPDAEDVVPGYLPGTLHKRMPGEPDDCAPLDAPAPARWRRSGSGDDDHQGSTVSHGIDLDVCQFDTAAHAKSAYDT
ncbi:hypothetical protein ACFVU3_21505 [Streptomyces sp. NPDC058052]|uniref:hypothetical protein n=1 Tax=Streptomyces sp. NPDC058052 TaxID=3346316 RepID=UPI0036E78B83